MYTTQKQSSDGSRDCWWLQAAIGLGTDLTGFPREGSLADRLAWARNNGWTIAGILARQSTRMQHSIDDQSRECCSHAVRLNMYVPPEYVCSDIVTGRKEHRSGLAAMTALLEKKCIDTLLVYKVSRLFRSAHMGFAYLQDHVVDLGLRAISVTQGIDTSRGEQWKMLMLFHGLSDEMLITATADHVRAGLAGLFLQRFVVGALTVGFRGVEVSSAPPTKTGRPRRMPQIDPDAAPFILRAFESIRDGSPVAQAWQDYVRAGGPYDPRATSKRMAYPAFRRMLSNPRYIGKWAFGRKRNKWSTRRDATRQIDAPEHEIRIFQSEDLRIVSDELFFAVQKKLANRRLGPRSPRKSKVHHLWDLVTDVFFCSKCKVRFYQTGARGHGMSCKNLRLCPVKTAVRRREAVEAVITALVPALLEDRSLVDEIVAKSRDLDAVPDFELQAEAARLEHRVAAIDRGLQDLMEMLLDCGEEIRAATKLKIRTAGKEKADCQHRLAELRQRLRRSSVSISPEMVREAIRNLSDLLQKGASGQLGSDQVHRAAEVFRLLVGGRIEVFVEKRPRRKHVNVRGKFAMLIAKVVTAELGAESSKSAPPDQLAEVWLRKRPKRDLLADRVHELIDIKGMSFRDAAATLQSEGHTGNSGVVWQIYQRYYEMVGQPVPKRPYNNGHPRQLNDT